MTTQTLADKYAQDLAAQIHHAAQDALVGKYLVENGQADRDYLYNIGLPPVGRILNPRGRIHELRAKGWDIKTCRERGQCVYKLISAPNVDMSKVPKITMIGEDGIEEVPYHSLPEPTTAVELADYFKPVRISSHALNMASKVIPAQYWSDNGLHAFLTDRANKVFDKLSSSQTEGQYGKLKYIFEFDADGPVLKTVSLV